MDRLHIVIAPSISIAPQLQVTSFCQSDLCAALQQTVDKRIQVQVHNHGSNYLLSHSLLQFQSLHQLLKKALCVNENHAYANCHHITHIYPKSYELVCSPTLHMLILIVQQHTLQVLISSPNNSLVNIKLFTSFFMKPMRKRMKIY